ncbi:hypothetical protein GL50803_001902 [Giardia duodenalis]|uniref:Uncharacterized protein n=1 Tax=Giardia intestinalis (strain ATCC 50803 / WB clone C6) TaxID=184922 RepID=D3KHD5_GIAIC|nr:hypothetical protein GL50803_001902 [Giardia intestinalis]KAE8304886.1 hypothetical protein GL50803_001902 [Giardia intestinalis]
MIRQDVPSYKLFNYALPPDYDPLDIQEFTTVLLVDVLAAHRRGYNPDKLLTIGTGAGRLSGVFLRVYDGQTVALSVDSTQASLSAAVAGHNINGYGGRSVYCIGQDLSVLENVPTAARFSLIAYNPYNTDTLHPGRLQRQGSGQSLLDQTLAEFIALTADYLDEKGRAFIVIETTKELGRHQRAAGQLGLHFRIEGSRPFEGHDYSVVLLSRQKTDVCA